MNGFDCSTSTRARCVNHLIVAEVDANVVGTSTSRIEVGDNISRNWSAADLASKAAFFTFLPGRSLLLVSFMVLFSNRVFVLLNR